MSEPRYVFTPTHPAIAEVLERAGQVATISHRSREECTIVFEDGYEAFAWADELAEVTP